jgi:hypothetical protein
VLPEHGAASYHKWEIAVFPVLGFACGHAAALCVAVEQATAYLTTFTNPSL